LRDEIQSLHREMDSSRRSLFQDRATGAWNRQKLEGRIEELVELGEAFVAVILWVSNLKRLEASLPLAMVDGGLKAMVQRATVSLGSNPHGTQPILGRWASDQFLVLLEVDATAAVAMSNDLAHKLSSRYAVQYDGISHQLRLHVATAVVDHTASGDARKLRARLEQMTGVALGLGSRNFLLFSNVPCHSGGARCNIPPWPSALIQTKGVPSRDL
jgi:GGDEF domain-containing protein